MVLLKVGCAWSAPRRCPTLFASVLNTHAIEGEVPQPVFKDFLTDDFRDGSKKVGAYLSDPTNIDRSMRRIGKKNFRDEVARVMEAGGKTPPGAPVSKEAQDLGSAVVGAQKVYDHLSDRLWRAWDFSTTVAWTPGTKVLPPLDPKLSRTRRYFTYTAQYLQQGTRYLAEQLLPVGLVLEIGSPERRAFSRLFFDPHYIPTRVELAALKKNAGILKAFEDRRAYELANPIKARVVRYLHGAKVAANVAIVGATLEVAAHSILSGPTTVDDIKREFEKHHATYGIDDNEMEIIVNAVPIPRMALRIGDQAYLLTRNEVKSMPYLDYIQGYHEEENERESDGNPDDSSAIIKSQLTPMSWDSSFEVVRLKLDQKTLQRLRAKFDEGQKSENKNRDFVSEAETMARLAISEKAKFDYVPGPDRFIGASPGQMLLSLGVQKAAGNANVEKVYTVLRNPTASFPLQIARNSLVHYSESRLFVQKFLLNQLVRTADGILHPVAPGGHESEQKQQLQTDMIRYDPEILAVLNEVQALPKADRSAEKLAALRSRLNQRWGVLFHDAKAKIGNDDTDYSDFIYADMLQSALPALQKRFDELAKH